MTKGPAPSAAYEHRSFGAPGAERTVVLLRAGMAALSDPLPNVTARYNVRIIAIGLTVDDIDDPAAYRGATAAEMTAATLAQFVRQERHGRTVGVVGVGDAGELAVLVAAHLGDAVDRLALVAVPQPATELGGDEVADLLEGLAAKTLIVNGQADPVAASTAARWFEARIPGARVEIVTETSDPQSRLVLAEVWDRVLSHAAPGTLR
ncbi:alpha/beta fold hydrolase [Microbacterium sp. E-13]|uniref:alpha/beta fold hydrolase n=1 Tax=Microbacterium sp. E-13 TaxID=3404048 RepID=UPI003CE7E60C